MRKGQNGENVCYYGKFSIHGCFNLDDFAAVLAAIVINGRIDDLQLWLDLFDRLWKRILVRALLCCVFHQILCKPIRQKHMGMLGVLSRGGGSVAVAGRAWSAGNPNWLHWTFPILWWSSSHLDSFLWSDGVSHCSYPKFQCIRNTHPQFCEENIVNLRENRKKFGGNYLKFSRKMSPMDRFGSVA